MGGPGHCVACTYISCTRRMHFWSEAPQHTQSQTPPPNAPGLAAHTPPPRSPCPMSFLFSTKQLRTRRVLRFLPRGRTHGAERARARLSGPTVRSGCGTVQHGASHCAWTRRGCGHGPDSARTRRGRCADMGGVDLTRTLNRNGWDIHCADTERKLHLCMAWAQHRGTT